MRKGKLFIIYFPVILIVCQVLVNLLYFADQPLYLQLGFYLNTFFGTNVLFAILLVTYTQMWNFCAVSRWAAIAELFFAVNYMIVKQDNMYNIMFQVIVGTIAIGLTFRHYIKKFPLCRLGLFVRFIHDVTTKGSCKKGIEKWERDNKSIILKNHVFNSNRF